MLCSLLSYYNPLLARFTLNSPGPDFSLLSKRLHMQSAQSQWALAMFFLIFFSTFAIEFRYKRFNIVWADISEPPVSMSDAHSEESRHKLDK